jgi:hypothetical protein
MRTIRGELASYLTGEQSLREFNSWFFPETWDIHQWAPVQVQDMVSKITLLLDEYSSGVWSETDLKAKLRPFVTSIEVKSAKAAVDPIEAEQVKLANQAVPKKVQVVSQKRQRRKRPAGIVAVSLFSSSWSMISRGSVVLAVHDVSVVASG